MRQRNEELHNLHSLNTYHKIVYIENDGMNRACSVHGADEKSMKILGRKPETEMQLGRHKNSERIGKWY